MLFFNFIIYALVIVIMEAFNFILSALRLRKRIKFKINLFYSFMLPLVCATASALVCRRLFLFNGAEATAVSLTLKLIFSLSVFFALFLPINAIFKAHRVKRLC